MRERDQPLGIQPSSRALLLEPLREADFMAVDRFPPGDAVGIRDREEGVGPILLREQDARLFEEFANAARAVREVVDMAVFS